MLKTAELKSPIFLQITGTKHNKVFLYKRKALHQEEFCFSFVRNTLTFLLRVLFFSSSRIYAYVYNV